MESGLFREVDYCRPDFFKREFSYRTITNPKRWSIYILQKLSQGKSMRFQIYDNTITAKQIAKLFKHSKGLFGYWSFDEGAGTIAHDQSAFKRDLFIHKGAWVKGNTDKALAFNGHSTHAIRNSISTFPQHEITTTFWIQTPNSKEAIMSFISDEVDGGCTLLDSHNLTFIKGDKRLITGVSVNDGLWHFIALSWRGSDGATTLFKDGQKVFSGFLDPKSVLSKRGKLLFGQSQESTLSGFNSQQAFEGNLDEFQIFDRVLGVQEIQTLYRQQKGLVGQWNFDEPFGDRAYDTSGFGNHATIRGSTRVDSSEISAMRFSNVDDVVLTEPIQQFASNEITTSFWIKTADVNDGIISYASVNSLSDWAINNSANLTIRRGHNSVLKTGVSINDNQWHFIAISWRSSDGLTKIYKDGSLAFVGNTSAGETINPNSGVLVFGQDQDTQGGGFETHQAFQGMLDCIQIYRTALDDAEIEALYLDYGTAVLWHFDEQHGFTATDDSGNDNHAAIHGPSWDSGHLNNGIKFQSKEDYIIRSPVHQFPTDKITTTLWIKTKDTSDAILSYASSESDNDWLIDHSENLRLTRKDVSVSTGVSINDGLWHFIAITWTGKNGLTKLYVDGTLAYTGELAPNTVITEGGTLVLGQDQDVLGGGFENSNAHHGTIDEVRIYNRILKDHEINLMFKRTRGLVGFWQFEEKQGNIAYDDSTFGNHLDINGATWTTGIQESGIQLNGSTAHLTLEKFPIFPRTEITSMFWIKTLDADEGLFSYTSASSKSEWMLSNSSNLTITRDQTSISTGITLNDGRWHFISVSWRESDGAITVFKDGKIRYTGTIDASKPLPPGGKLVLGQSQENSESSFSPQQAFNGKLDQIRIYSRVLAANELKSIFLSDKGLIGFWRMDEGYGKVIVDRSGKNNHGQADNIQWSPSPSHQAIVFNTNHSVVKIEPVKSFASAEITSTFWIKTSDSNDGIISYTSTASLDDWAIHNSANLRIRRGSAPALTTGVSINDNQWHFIAVTWSSKGGLTKLYKDGHLAYIGHLAEGTFITPSDGILVLGQDQDTLGGGFDLNQAFNGILDHVQIYNRALDEEEINTLYFSYGLIAFWPLDEKGGRIASDASGHGNHAHVKGPTWASGKREGGAKYTRLTDHIIRNPMYNFPVEQITTTFWIKTKDANEGIISYASTKTDNDWLISDSSNLSLTRASSPIKTGISINDDLWHFIAVTWSLQKQKAQVFKDGTLLFSGPLNTLKPFDIGGSLVIGQDQDSLGGGFNLNEAFLGKIDNIRIYNRILSPNDIEQLYNRGNGLLASWLLEEAKGSTAKDSSFHKNDANILNATRVHERGQGAILFNNANSVIQKDQFKSFPSIEITTTFWLSTSDSLDTLISYSIEGADNIFEIYDSNNLSIRIGDDHLSTGISVNDNKWHYIALSWRKHDGKVKLFKNGVKVSEGNVGANHTLAGNGLFTVGQHIDSSQKNNFNSKHSFLGRIDNIHIYDHVLLEGQINRLYYAHGLIASWAFEEYSGLVAHDSSGQQNHMILHGAKFQKHNAKYGIHFSNSTDFAIREPLFNAPTTEITTAFWIKTDDESDGIISYASELSDNDWFISNSKSLNISRGDIGIDTKISINDNQWHFVAATWKNTSGKTSLYIDGQLLFTGTMATGSTLTPNGILVLGQDQDSLGGDFQIIQAHQGSIDKLSIYSRALKSSEIQSLYHMSKTARLRTKRSQNAIYSNNSSSSLEYISQNAFIQNGIQINLRAYQRNTSEPIHNMITPSLTQLDHLSGLTITTTMLTDILTSESLKEHDAKWNIVDGNLSTLWSGSASSSGWWVLLVYEESITAERLEVYLNKDSLQPSMVLGSTDSKEWVDISSLFENNPHSFKYLWIIFHANTNGTIPIIQEIRPLVRDGYR